MITTWLVGNGFSPPAITDTATAANADDKSPPSTKPDAELASSLVIYLTASAANPSAITARGKASTSPNENAVRLSFTTAVKYCFDFA